MTRGTRVRHRIDESTYFSFKNASICKHNDKEKYFAGQISIDEGTNFLVDDKGGSCVITDKYHKISGKN